MVVIDARLRAAFSALIRDRVAAIFLCTVFRRIEPDTMAKGPGSAVARMERIRRLNLLATELSHDLNINIIDLDRTFAHMGGRSLGTDYKLRGVAALSAATHVIASTFFAAGLDEFCPPELQDAAKVIYEHHRTDLAQSGLAVSARTLHYLQVDDGKRLQNFASTLGAPRRLGDLWLNLRGGQATAKDTLLAVLRVVRKRLRQRLNRMTF